MKELSEIFSRLSSAKDAVHDALEPVRNDIAHLKAKRSAIASASISRAEALARLDQGLEVKQQSFRADARVFTSPEPHNKPWEGLPPLIGPRAEAILYMLLGGEIREFYATVIDAHLDANPPGLPLDERAKALAALDAQIRAKECLEEAIIVKAEAAGIVIERRPDADPAVVLGITDSTSPTAAA